MTVYMERHFIWFAGDTNSLIKKILDEVGRYRADAVRQGPSPSVLFDLTWKNSRFAVRHDDKMGLMITMPEDASDSAQWQKELKAFYDQVVRPLADRTGGIAVGISLPEEEILDGAG